MKYALLWLLPIVCLAACATPGSTWIASSRFDYRAYERRNVTLLPVVTSPLVTDARLDKEAIATTVAQELGTLELYNVKLGDVAGAYFPYTPQRLAALGRKLNADVAIGVNITRMDVPQLSRKWSITGSVTFVDVMKPARFWTLAKTWQFSGDPGSIQRVKQQLRDSLRADFTNVRAALQTNRAAALPKDQSVLVGAGPILSIDAAGWTLTAAANTMRGRVTIVDPDSYAEAAPQLQIDYAATDDEGIAEVVIENSAAAFRTSILRNQPEGKGPIYLADRLLVPIASGFNNIKVRATNAKGQSVTRNLEFTNEPAANERTRELMLISAAKFPQLPDTELLMQTKEIVSKLESQRGATLDGNRALAFAGENATRERILLTAADQWAQPRSDTRRELAVLGRAEMIDGEPFIYLYNSDLRYPIVGALSLQELKQLLAMGVSKTTLELCTRESESTQLRDFYQGALGPRATVTVKSGCEEPLGEKLLEVTRTLREPRRTRVVPAPQPAIPSR